MVQAITFLDPDGESLASSATEELTVNTVSVSPNPAGITIGEVRTATNEALNSNPRLQDTENIVAYMNSDGNAADVGDDSQLASLKPKVAAYDANVDYTTFHD